MPFRVPSPAASLSIAFNDIHQTMDGFGVSDIFLDVNALTDAQADFFFDASAGLGLSLLRMGPRSDGSLDSFYSNATKAAARGARIFAAPMTATAAMKDNGSETNGGHLLVASYTAWANVLTTFASNFASNTGGVNLYAMSVQNEPDFSASYVSMVYTAAEMTAFIKVLGPLLHALSPSVKLISSEAENWDHAVTFLADTLADSTAAGYLDIVATHQYEGTVVPLSSGGRSVWQTEWGSFGAFDASMSNALTMAATVHSALTTGNVSAWCYYWQIGDQADNLGLRGQSADFTQTTKRSYALGNWSKFVRPGMVRCGITGTVSGVSATAFKMAATGAMAIVAINANGTPTTFYTAMGGLTVPTVTPWITDASRDLVAQTAVPVNGSGTFSCVLPASSVTTFVGTGS